MELKPGKQLRSAASTAELIVIRVPAGDVQLRIDDGPLGPDEESLSASPDGSEHAIQLGKRYTAEELGVELLCTRPGSGSLTCNGQAMTVKGAKPLPASD